MVRKVSRRILPAVLLGMGLGWSVVAPGVAAATSTDTVAPTEQAVELGRQIYFEGKGEPGHEPMAMIGRGGTEVPAALLTCKSCHGEDGRGRPEGGVNPSDLTWPALTRPYVHRTADGREHPPYDEAKLKRAITMGLDPAGNSLHVAMPLYRLTHKEADALVAFIKTLGQEQDDGIGDQRLRIGVLLPPPGLGQVGVGQGGEGQGGRDLAGAIRSALEAVVAERDDGIHGRSIELVYLQPEGTPAERRTEMAALLERQNVFALVAGFLIGAEHELADLFRELEVPLIGAFAYRSDRPPGSRRSLNPYVFYLTTGLPDQARALAAFAAQPSREVRRPRILVPEGDVLIAESARAIVEQANRQGTVWADLTIQSYAVGAFDPESTARALRDDGVDGVFFLGSSAEGLALERAVGRLDHAPTFFLLGPLVDPRIFDWATSAGCGKEPCRLFLALPSVPGDTSPRAFEAYRALATQNRLPTTHLSGQLTTIASFKVLVEALERAGRKLSREKLLDSLESLYRFETGLTPALTFGPNRRVGAYGAYVGNPDPERRLLTGRSEWVELR